MIIVNYRAGQLGNRLFHFAHMIAYSRHYHASLIYPYFEDYSDLFDFDRRRDYLQSNRIKLSYCSFSLANKVIRSLVWRIGYFCYKKQIRSIACFYFLKLEDNMNCHPLDDPELNKIAQTKCLSLSGWMFRDYKHFEEFSHELRYLFTPRKPILEEVHSEIFSCKKEAHILVGVHIRRGDYREFLNGQLYFDDAVYHDYMLRIQHLFAIKHLSCLFFICANEDINLNHYSDLKVVFKRRHFMVDLYCLSMCDYIVGPPSTFSQWASFYGKVPLKVFSGANESIELSDFQLSYASV